MDFFDDDAAGQTPKDAGGPPSAPPQRRRPNRRRTRIQRLAILALILFLVVFGLAWWARSCQHSRKVGSYSSYFDGVGAAIGDSETLGKQFSTIVQNPTKLSKKELIAKLAGLATSQNEIAVRAGRLEPPGSLTDEQAVFSQGMRVRASGYKLLQAAMLGALASKKVGPAKIAALDGYFSGPDAYYMDLAYLPARTTMSDDGVTDVPVPTSTYYLTWTAMDPARLTGMLDQLGSSAKISGIHGVSLVSATAQTATGDVKLVVGHTANVPASADLAFVVSVQNGGNATETNVPVTATLTAPGGSPIKKEASIASIAAGKTQDVIITGWAIPPEAISKEVTLKVVAGPVPHERDASNNSATYKLVLQLK